MLVIHTRCVVVLVHSTEFLDNPVYFREFAGERK